MTNSATSTCCTPETPGRQGLYDPAEEHDACGIGFVAHVLGERSHEVVRNSLQLLRNLSHRSAVGSDAGTGDGAGILLQIPHVFLRGVCREVGVYLPEAGAYGVAMVFLPTARQERLVCEELLESAVSELACRVLGWRDVPVDRAHAGDEALRTLPVIRQLFVARGGIDGDMEDPSAFERTLYVIRKHFEGALRRASGGAHSPCHIASFSSRTIVYKGLLLPGQLSDFYTDLAKPAVVSALGLVHSRFSTNTFPSWPRAHPYRMVCHNGEINTLRGNVNWKRVREEQIASPRLGRHNPALFPIIQENQSDSACFDNALELLVMGGRSLAHALMMLIPEAWEHHATMPSERRSFYEYHAALMEPWDGPAAMAFTDGRQIGALLDRNGLRPARYVVTNDDMVVLASEAGALPIPAANIRSKGRLQPGKLLLVNTTLGRILDDEEVKGEITSRRPYRRWISEQCIDLADLTADEHSGSPPAGPLPGTIPLATSQQAFGYTREELKMILAPMASTAAEPTGSMGNDTPLAVLSDQPRLLFSYFRQRFAQVTNPAIDPIREQLVMSLRSALGRTGNLLDETPVHARLVRLEQPVLTGASIAALRAVTEPSLRVTTIETLFRAADGASALAKAVDTLCRAATDAIRSGCGILVLSDRGATAEWAPIPSVLAVAAVHHHLIRSGLRSRVGLVSEAGDAREVAHIALLIGYGAGAVHPWLALETVAALAREGVVPGVSDADRSQVRYVKAAGTGLLKIMSKMGVSTLQSYCGAQVCEAIGLEQHFVDRHFDGTASRIGGIGMDVIGKDVLRRHAAAFTSPAGPQPLAPGGDYHFRMQAEHHQWNPLTISTLQRAARTNSFTTFKEFSALANDEGGRPRTLRALLDFADRTPVPLAEVEPVTAIARRFVTGAMSFGSISREAHETLAVAMNRLGGRSNTGEGGEDAARFGTDRNSATKQVASARFGVTAEYLVNADELQIKIAQGAKPGEGGQLPGHKVDAVIARTRFSTPGVTLISPPPHHDIYIHRRPRTADL